jgi:hypothetical protein
MPVIEPGVEAWNFTPSSSELPSFQLVVFAGVSLALNNPEVGAATVNVTTAEALPPCPSVTVYVKLAGPV